MSKTGILYDTQFLLKWTLLKLYLLLLFRVHFFPEEFLLQGIDLRPIRLKVIVQRK